MANPDSLSSLQTISAHGGADAATDGHAVTADYLKRLSRPKWRDSLILAVIYVLTAKIGQIVAIDPGNVTPIWIPSGIILAAVLVRGWGVWPGVFVGAFVGNVSAYISFESVETLLAAVAAGTANGSGDVLCALGGAYLIERSCRTTFPFLRSAHVFRFVLYGALLGPLVSALFGVTALSAAGLSAWADFERLLLIWWTGDAVGVLVLTPMLLSLAYRRFSAPLTAEHVVYFATLLAGIAYGLGFLVAHPGHMGLFALLPISMWSIFRLDLRSTFLSAAVIAIGVGAATIMGHGWIAHSVPAGSVVELQQYVFVLVVTMLVLQAIREEERHARSALSDLNVELDNLVMERTADLEAARADLEHSQRRLSYLVDTLEAGVVVHQADSSIRFANRKAVQLLGVDAGAIVGKRVEDPAWHFIDEKGAGLAVDDYPVSRIMRSGEPLKEQLLGIVKEGDDTTWVLVDGLPDLDEQGRISEVFISFVDVTEIKEAQLRLTRAATVFDNTIEGVAITDENGRIIDVNPAFIEITGYSREEVIGQNPRMLKSGRHDDAFYREMWASLQREHYWRGEIWNRRKNGTIYPELLTISAVLDDQGQANAFIGIFSDISHLKAYEEQLEFMAHHDGLTGLANRTYFTEYLELGLQAAERKKSSLAVLFLDLDQFKSVNDTLGHRVGDQLLEAVANRMKAVIRDNDVLSRISGDEFVFLLQDIQNEQDIQIATERVMGAFAEPFSIEDNMLKLTASIGISVYPRDTENAQQLMQHADAAMYNAKEEGRNTYRFFTSEMSKAVAEDAVIGSALAMALGNEELGVHYQPQIDLNEGNVVGLEALVRWNNPRLGQVPPDRFIPVAEQRGLMVEIGNFVLRTACRQGQSWRDAGIGPFKIAVNVSGLQFQSVRYLADLQAILDETGFPPEWLELELTESILMKRTEALVSLLNALSGMGIGIAIDDFGTGYSSLSYLSKLPVDKLKVDKQFVRDVLDDENDAALAASIIAMGRALDIDVVAEGVETTQQAEFLRAHGCKLVQGYLYGRPMPADDLAEHLHAIASAERDPR